MPTWTFINSLNKEPIDLVDPRWVFALEAALGSQATPSQSGYHVNTGAITKNGNVVSGSNHEMAITDTITHGEEAVIASALDAYGRDDPIQVIAFAGFHDVVIVPCGNCRDAIQQYTDLDNLVVINAPRDGGTAVLAPGRAFFKSDFNEVGEEERERLINSNVWVKALRAEKIAYDVYATKNSPRIYGAAIVCEKGTTFMGSYRGDVAYHPVLPISAAIGNFRDSSDDPSRRHVKEIVVAATGSVPDVMYKDRQHALEFAEAIQSLNGRSGTPLPVYLVDVRDDGSRMSVLKTDTSEWLPFCFSPAHLGLEKTIAGGYEKLFKE